MPVIDPDIWHIKTGEYIANTYSLPQEDPFSYTADNDRRTAFILKQYWLAQVLYYYMYKIGGWWGIITLRMIIYLSMAALFIRFSRKLNLYLRVGLVGFLIFALNNYVADRPVAFSLLFFSLTIYLIEKEKYFFIPFVMLIWANCHGGFITGDLVLFLYGMDSMIKRRYKIALMLFSGIITSLINPNFWGAFIEFIYGNPEYYKGIAEYKSPAQILMGHQSMKIAYYGIALGGIFLLLIPKLRQFRLSEILVIALFLFFSFKHVRVAPFLSIFLSFISVKYLQAYNEKISERLPRVDSVALAVIIFIIGILAWDKRDFSAFSEHIYYPRQLSKFFKENKPQPNIYNDYNIGGFLIFALYPEYRVFTDTRGIGLNAMKEGSEIKAVSGNIHTILSKYNIKIIVTTVMDPFLKTTSPLIVYLHSVEAWKLVLIDGTIAVFVKDIPEHSEIIRKFEIEKDNIFRMIVTLCGAFLRGDENNAYLYFLLGSAYEKLGLYEEASKAIKAGLEIKKEKPAEDILRRIEQKMKDTKDLSD
ncbi:MAG: tetratricopeptide repeat protein, partial [Nitrospirota bacterium]